MFRSKRVAAFLACFLLLGVGHVFGQSRTEESEKKKAEKSKHLHPYIKNKAEKVIDILTAPRRGLYPALGSAHPGGGAAFGPGYFRPFGDNNLFHIFGLWSIENYKAVDGTLGLSGPGILRTEAHTRYEDAGHVKFFGVGNDTTPEGRTNFRFQPFYGDVMETVHPVRWFSIGGSIGYLHVNSGHGDQKNSIEKIYDESEAPGLRSDPDYTVSRLFAAIDWRQSPGYTTRGGYYSIGWSDYNDHAGSFSFRRVDVEVDQYFPIFRANQIIVVRGMASLTDTNGDSQVPYYLMPTLGGGRYLRGFTSDRFHDLNSMLLTAEYRWTPSKLLDLAIFYETGKVASRRGDLDFSDLHDTYGIGARFHAPAATILRVEIAHSSEATRLVLSTGAFF